tara:strand:- start:243 stop:1496 length:1254 start_codon:yes stop_codon:yes gene_type:complete
MKEIIKNSCINEFDPNALEEIQAINKIIKVIKPNKSSEKVNIKDALHRTISSSVRASINVPSFRNSAMDGYAINLHDLKLNKFKLSEIGVSFAGKPFRSSLRKGGTVRVMTGALIPKNADAVIMKEMVSKEGIYINFPQNIKKNQNIRFAGEDIKKGETVFKQGDELDFSGLSILSSLGIEYVDVFCKPKVSYFSSGDELVATGKKLQQGQIYDSNRYLLHGLLKDLPVVFTDLGIVKDKKLHLVNKLRRASEKSDIIITTGGVSVGDADYIKDALNEVGSVGFWKIAIKPGRPLAFGKINDSYFFGLPGNPVSAAVTFQLFVIPAINRLLSQKRKKMILMKAISKNKLKKKPGRTEYKRAILSIINNKTYVETTGLQGSNIMMSMLRANCYIRLSTDVSDISKGDIVEIIPFSTKL